jgi:hypothetical protein
LPPAFMVLASQGSCPQAVGMIGKGGASLDECSSAATELFESRYRAAGFVPSISRARRAAASASESRASRKNIADKLAQLRRRKISCQFSVSYATTSRSRKELPGGWELSVCASPGLAVDDRVVPSFMSRPNRVQIVQTPKMESTDCP